MNWYYLQYRPLTQVKTFIDISTGCGLYCYRLSYGENVNNNAVLTGQLHNTTPTETNISHMKRLLLVTDTKISLSSLN